MTLKLFYSPGACSLVSHIALEEAGADFEAVRVMLAQGEQLRPDYLAINPHARVPALVTGEGVVTENVAILNYLADRFGAQGSVPRGNPFATARCNELLGWFASSVHIAFAQLFRPGRFVPEASLHEDVKAGGRSALDKYFAEIESMSGDRWLVEDFTAADSYLLTFYRWAKNLGFDVASYPRWAALAERVLERPAVRKAIADEGLSPSEFGSSRS